MSFIRSSVWEIAPDELLTAVIPAHNRVEECLTLLRYLRSCGFAHPIVVADSSRSDRARTLQNSIGDLARYQYFGSRIGQYTKLSRLAQCVSSPYIVVLPDDDIAFPHAIEASLKYLQDHKDYVAAHGYSLRFGLERSDFDIYKVEHFIPTIGEEKPIQRYFHLMRRYQPHIWAVFRTSVYAKAMEEAAAMRGTVFQEYMFQIVSVLGGKVARLPTVYAMRGMAPSQADYSQADPFQWLIKDADSLFRHYATFRRGLINFFLHGTTKPNILAKICRYIRQVRMKEKHLAGEDRNIPLRQIVDLINASCLGREIHIGTINHAVQHALGDAIDAVKFPEPWQGWSEVGPRDLIRPSRRPDRQYVWRCAVLEAEPRDEIRITADEMMKVETQLEFYDLRGKTT